MEKTKKIKLFLELFVILLFITLVGSGAVIGPFFGDINVIDEGQHAAWIRHMLNGEYLYKDIYAAYGPIYIYPFYLLAKVFGPSFFLLRLVYLVSYTFLAILSVRFLLQMLKIHYLVSLCAITLLLIVPGIGMRQGIGFLVIILGYLAFEKKQYKLSLLSGASVGLSYLVSPEIGIFSTIICVILFGYHLILSKNISMVLKMIAGFFLGVIAVFVPFFIWAQHEGWLSAYIENTLTDMRIYSGVDLPNGKSFPNALQLFPSTFSLVAFLKYIFSKEMLLYWLFLFNILTFLYLLSRLILGKWKSEHELLLLLTLYGFLLSIILIGRYGHFAFTIAPAVIVAAYFFNTLLNKYRLAKQTPEKIMALVIMCILIIFATRLISIYRPHFHRISAIPQNTSMQTKAPKFVGPISISESQKKEIETIQAFIESNTDPRDNVFFLNNEPAMYLLVNRGNPTRYDIPAVANTKEKRLEVLNDVIQGQTEYIIYNENAWSIDEISNLRRIPELVEYMKENYEAERVGGFQVYKLRKD